MTTPEEHDRLANLEVQFTYQDQLLTTLNQLVYEQQKTITRLEKELGQLREQVVMLSDHPQGSGPEPPPPHY
jgi:SlyX protein